MIRVGRATHPYKTESLEAETPLFRLSYFFELWRKKNF